MDGIIEDNELMKIKDYLIKILKHDIVFKFIEIKEIEDATSYAIEIYLKHRKNGVSMEEFPRKEKLEAWLYVIAKNKLLNLIKKKIHFKETINEFKNRKSDISQNQNIENIIANFWKIILKYTKLNKVEIIILQKHHIEGIKLKDLAEELNMTQNAIYLKNSRLIKKIKTLMKKKNIKEMTDLDF